MTRIHTLILAIAAVSLVGCSNQADGEPPDVSKVEPVNSDSQLPFEAYALDDSQQSRLLKAYTDVVQECALTRGVTLKPTSSTAELSDPDSEMWNGLFGTMTLAHAQKYGYHAGPDEPRSQSTDLFADQGSPTVDDVLSGDDGCLATTTKKFGIDPHDLELPQQEKFRLAAYRDKRTKDAEANWSTCMKQAGFSYSTVDEPIDSIAGNALTQEETQIAEADVTCTKSSRWRDISFAIEAAYQSRALDDDPEMYAKLRDTRLKQLTRIESAAAGKG